MNMYATAAVRAALATTIYAGLMVLSGIAIQVFSYIIYFAVLWAVFVLFSFWEQGRGPKSG